MARDTRFQKGSKHTEEWKAMMSVRMRGNQHALGNVLSEETRTQMGLSRMGHTHGFKKGAVSPFKGKRHTEEALEKNRRAHLGKKHSPETRAKKKGKKAWNWREDRTYALERSRLANSQDWKSWRIAVFTRDNFTCAECNITGGHLEPHHIIPIRLEINRVFDIDNGITLCLRCHKKTFRKELEFSDKYSRIAKIRGG